MRIHQPKIPQLAREILDALVSNKDIETGSNEEVRRDIESVLAQFAREEQAVSEKARDLQAARSLPPSEVSRMRKLLATERGIKVGDEAIDYLLDQLIEILMHSPHVEEVWAEDLVLRRRMRDPLRRHAAMDEQIQQEVRAQLKHVKEGGAVWEVEYQRMMEEIRRRKGL